MMIIWFKVIQLHIGIMLINVWIYDNFVINVHTFLYRTNSTVD